MSPHHAPPPAGAAPEASPPLPPLAALALEAFVPLGAGSARTRPLDLVLGAGEVVGLVGGDAAARRALARALAGIAPWRGRAALHGRERLHGTPGARRATALLGPAPSHEGPRVADVLAAERALFGIADPGAETADLLAAWGAGAATPLRALGDSRRALLELRLALARRPELLVTCDFLGRLGTGDAATWLAGMLAAAAARDVVVACVEAEPRFLAALPGGAPRRVVVLRGAEATPLELALPGALERWRVVVAEAAAPAPPLAGEVARAAGGGRLMALVNADDAEVALGALRLAGAARAASRAATLADLGLLLGGAGRR